MAGFLSPVVAQVSLSDPLVSEYLVEIDDSNGQFEMIMKLGLGISIEIDEICGDYFIQVGKALGNDEIVEIGVQMQNNRQENTNLNVIERLKQRMFYQLDQEQEIAFIASNICEIDSKSLESLEKSVLEKIFTSSCLNVESESWLFSLIERIIIKNGSNYSSLLSCIMSEYLSPNEMSRFVELVSFDKMNNQLWRSLCKRLVLNVGKIEKKVRCIERQVLDFVFKSQEPLTGVFRYMYDAEKENPHTRGIIEVTSSTTEYNEPHQVLNNQWKDFWYSKDEPNQWLCIDFKEKKLNINYYSIKTHGSGPGFSHIKSWIIEGSVSGHEWVIIDSKQNNFDLNRRNAIVSYSIINEGQFRYIRIKQTGKNHSGSNYLCLAGLELFGKLF